MTGIAEITPPRWLLLIHSIPPVPAYFRVKVRRRLRRLGAVALKNSVYLLPYSEESLEDLRWLAQEIRKDGGEATLTSADVIDGPSDAELGARLRGAQVGTPMEASVSETMVGELRGRTWVTRAGIKVDRMSSAWLIKTFIDPKATFRFATDAAPPKPGELRFDTYEGEFTHEGERCTFEVLVERCGLSGDPALVALAEIVHDLDCKDSRFGRREAAGVALSIEGIVRGVASDEERLKAGSELFGSLYRALK